MENIIKGSCHCGAVEFELKGNPKLVVNCHCNDCKKRNGSAYSTYMAVQESDLSVVKGKNTLQGYSVKNVGIKQFCSQCGSPIYNENYRYPGLYMLFYGAFNESSNFSPDFNVYCESKYNWVESIHDITSFQGPIER